MILPPHTFQFRSFNIATAKLRALDAERNYLIYAFSAEIREEIDNKENGTYALSQCRRIKVRVNGFFVYVASLTIIRM